MLSEFIFVKPQYLWLLICVPFLGIWVLLVSKRQRATLTLSVTEGLQTFKTFKNQISNLPNLLRLLGLSAWIVALAQPRKVDVDIVTKKAEGIDIVMAVDISASMLAKDLQPNRLEALKRVAGKFINDRVNDRIGIVVYSGESYTKVPATTDKVLIHKSLRDIHYSNTLEQGTAIGMGLLNSVNRLRDSDAKSKVIILLTDGVNNSGFINPKIAYDLATELGIKVYTIGVGTNGLALSPVGILPNGKLHFKKVPVKIDEELLKEIAKATGGKYYRANNNKRLEDIYAEIDRLEKTEIEQTKHYSYTEYFRHFIVFGLLVILLAFLTDKTLLKGAI